MRIGADEHRLYWKVLGIGFVVDLIGVAVVIVVLNKVFGTDSKNDEFLLAVGIAWLALQFLRFVITLLDIARLWAAKEAGAFKSSGEAFLAAVRNPSSYINWRISANQL